MYFLLQQAGTLPKLTYCWYCFLDLKTTVRISLLIYFLVIFISAQ